MKLNRISILLGGVVLLAAVGAAAYYLGVLKGADVPEGRAPQQIPVAAPQIQWNTAATYDNWQMRCRNGATASDRNACIGLLEVVNTKKHQLILGWLVGLNGKGGISSSFQTPTGVIVARGVDVKIGDSAVRHAQYSSCNARGCEASIAMDSSFVNDLESAEKAQITVYAQNGKAVNIGIPVKGADKVLGTFKQ